MHEEAAVAADAAVPRVDHAERERACVGGVLVGGDDEPAPGAAPLRDADHAASGAPAASRARLSADWG